MDLVWRLAPGQRLAHRGWDGEYVLYNDLSGDTHLVGADALRLLQTLQRSACAEAALAGALALAGDAVAALLDELEVLSLIEPVPC